MQNQAALDLQMATFLRQLRDGEAPPPLAAWDPCGNFAYAISRPYRLNLKDPSGSRAFFQQAEQSAAGDPLLRDVLTSETQ
jgi:hypothetical protein